MTCAASDALPSGRERHSTLHSQAVGDARRDNNGVAGDRQDRALAETNRIRLRSPGSAPLEWVDMPGWDVGARWQEVIEDQKLAASRQPALPDDDALAVERVIRPRHGSQAFVRRGSRSRDTTATPQAPPARTLSSRGRSGDRDCRFRRRRPRDGREFVAATNGLDCASFTTKVQLWAQSHGVIFRGRTTPRRRRNWGGWSPRVGAPCTTRRITAAMRDRITGRTVTARTAYGNGRMRRPKTNGAQTRRKDWLP